MMLLVCYHRTPYKINLKPIYLLKCLGAHLLFESKSIRQPQRRVAYIQDMFTSRM